jgi:hypothetical protein
MAKINELTDDFIIGSLESKLKDFGLEGVEITSEDATSIRDMVARNVSFDDAVDAVLSTISAVLE